MTATNRTEAERLIVEFLDANDQPTAADWKVLADKHPEHASAFVDAALVRAVGDAADASAEPYEFDAGLATRMVSKGLSKLHQTSSAQLELAQDDTERCPNTGDLFEDNQDAMQRHPGQASA